jgi:hypothetical protein
MVPPARNARPSTSLTTRSNRVSSNQSLRCRETEFLGQRQSGRNGCEGSTTPLQRQNLSKQPAHSGLIRREPGNLVRRRITRQDSNCEPNRYGVVSPSVPQRPGWALTPPRRGDFSDIMRTQNRNLRHQFAPASQVLDIASLVARQKRFELLTPRFVVWRSPLGMSITWAAAPARRLSECHVCIAGQLSTKVASLCARAGWRSFSSAFASI